LGIKFSSAPVTSASLELGHELLTFGPDQATGAIVWVSGRVSLLGHATQIRTTKTPNYLREFNNHGWDVYRYFMPSEPEGNPDEAEALQASVVEKFDSDISDLSGRGYKRILLAGHSWGATISFYRAPRLPFINGIIATSPAFARNYPPTKADIDRALQILLSGIRALAGRQLRASLVMAGEDEFNPNPQLRLSLAAGGFDSAQIPSLTINLKDDKMRGHQGAEHLDFALDFGSCLRSFFEKANPELHETCSSKLQSPTNVYEEAR
jgi:pimeloyl-ACP methyl ester carboxylesterase